MMKEPGVGGMDVKVHDLHLDIIFLRRSLDCLKLTKAIQKTAETLQAVADLHDDNVLKPLKYIIYLIFLMVTLGKKASISLTRNIERRGSSFRIVHGMP